MLAYAIDRKLTAQVLGNARLILNPADWSKIEAWIATTSPEANASMARSDPEGEGFTVETVAFDLAHLGARAVNKLRATPGWAKCPVEGCFDVYIGDWLVRFIVRQAAKRGDLHVAIESAKPDEHAEELPDFVVKAIREGRPVMAFGPQGMVNLTELGRSSFPRSDFDATPETAEEWLEKPPTAALPGFPTRCADARIIAGQIDAGIRDGGAFDLMAARDYEVLPCDCGDPGGAGLAFTAKGRRVEIWLRWDDTYVIRMDGQQIAEGVYFMELTERLFGGFGMLAA